MLIVFLSWSTLDIYSYINYKTLCCPTRPLHGIWAFLIEFFICSLGRLTSLAHKDNWTQSGEVNLDPNRCDIYGTKEVPFWCKKAIKDK